VADLWQPETKSLNKSGKRGRYAKVSHVQQSGKIVFFRVQYETKIGDDWYPVVRYDTAHGFAHRDLLNLLGNIRKTPLFNQNYNDALSFAESDLKTNWLFYKHAFTEGSEDE